MDIEKKINNLICKYNIDRPLPGFRLFLYAKDLIEEKYENLIKKNDTIVLAGCEETSIIWFQRNICKKRIPKCIFEDLENIPQKVMALGHKSCYLLVSIKNRDKLKAKLKECNVEIVDIYDLFENEEIYFQHNFYDIYELDYHNFRSGESTNDFEDFDINEIFFWHRRNYELEKEPEKRKKYLEKIIFDCVYARDFISLKEYIDIYNKDYKNEDYKNFFKETENLLREISTHLKRRNVKDCLMIWLDALEYGDDSNMAFLNGLEENALVFDNMYTVTPYTGPTFKTLFGKIRTIEEKSFNVSKIDKNNSRFISSLIDKGYHFKYYGELDILEEEYLSNYYYSIYTTMTQIFWYVLCDVMLQKKDEKGFFVLHEVLQTHIPYISLGLRGTAYSNRENWVGQQEENKKLLENRQALESRLYVDKQLDFWNKILPDCMYKIYMSDHGHTFLGRFHTIFKICQRDINIRHCEKILSYYDFDKIMIQILENNDIDETQFDSEYVLVQDVDYYYKDYILDYIKQEDFTPDGMIGYQGVITKEDMLISYRHGVEYYQKNINNELCVTEARLNYLRNCLSKSKIDIYSEEKFKYSRIIWEANQRCSKRTVVIENKKRKIIKRVFDEFPSNRIVGIRGGGIHTLRLLMLLNDTQRRKISYIIDNNKDCVASKMGIKVIHSEESEDIKWDYIILSSYDFRNQWKEELKGKNLGTNVNIIDIYDEFARENIFCKKEFYKKEFIKDDFSY